MSSTIGSPGADHPVGRLVVRRGGVGPRADDRELGAVVALVDEPVPDLAGDVGLRAPDEPAVGDLVDHPVGGLGGEAQQGDLVGVLDDPQVAQDERRGLEHRRRAARPGAAGGGSPRAGRRRRGGPRRRGSRSPHRGHRVLGLLPGGDRDVAARHGRAPACRRRLEARHDERHRPLGRDDEHRQPLERHRARTRRGRRGRGRRRPGARRGRGLARRPGRGRSARRSERGNGRPAVDPTADGALMRGEPPLGRRGRGRRGSPAPAPGPPARPPARRGRPRTASDTRGRARRRPPGPPCRSAWSSCWPTQRTRRPAAVARRVIATPS